MGKSIRVPDPVYERLSKQSKLEDVSRGVIVKQWMNKADGSDLSACEAYVEQLPHIAIEVQEGEYGFDDHSETYRSGVAFGLRWAKDEFNRCLPDE